MTPKETGLELLAELGPGAFAVYWVLESHANKQGICWPSYETIAELSNLSRRQVMRHIEELQPRWITRQKRTKANGSADSNAYQITRYLVPEVVTRVVTEVVTVSHQGSDSVAPEVIPTELTGREKEQEKSLVQIEFEAWYQKYPKHEARKDAERAWSKLTADQRAQAMARLSSYRFSSDRKFIPLPATWLNGERWADEQPKETPKDILDGPRPNHHDDLEGWMAWGRAKAARDLI